MDNSNYTYIADDVYEIDDISDRYRMNCIGQNRLFNSIFFKLKDSNIEIGIMWTLIIITILLLLSLLVRGIGNNEETLRFIHADQ